MNAHACMRRCFAAACALVVLVPVAAHAQDAPGPSADARIAEAIALYDEAQGQPDRALRIAAFARAERLFATAARALGPSAPLQTNLGNAALQAGNTGSAVLAYRRALAADPSDARARRNLDHARRALPAWVPRPAPAGASDSLFFFHTQIARATRRFAAGAAFAVAGGLLGLGLATRRGWLRGLAWLPAVVWLALCASLFVEGQGGGDAAVVVASEAVARSSDSAFAAAAFAEPLPGGTEVEIVEERGSWTRARLANGRDAWLRASALAPVAMPEADTAIGIGEGSAVAAPREQEDG